MFLGVGWLLVATAWLGLVLAGLGRLPVRFGGFGWVLVARWLGFGGLGLISIAFGWDFKLWSAGH